MDNDTTMRKDSYFKILSAFSDGQADVLVGTQMIAKGHDFGNVTLVGILEADAALYFPTIDRANALFSLSLRLRGARGERRKKAELFCKRMRPNITFSALARRTIISDFGRKR